jgi:hypothetical protein
VKIRESHNLHFIRRTAGYSIKLNHEHTPSDKRQYCQYDENHYNSQNPRKQVCVSGRRYSPFLNGQFLLQLTVSLHSLHLM